MSDEISRRDLLKVLTAGGAAAALPVGKAQATPNNVPSRQLRIVGQSQLPASKPRGTPSDPDLINPKIWWEKVLTADELTTLTMLCDIIIPADDRSPAASSAGVPDYINEYVSAPYDGSRRDLVTVRGGLVWLDTEASRRFGKRFANCTLEEQSGICEDIHYLPDARPELRYGAVFFSLVRRLTATGFYTTPTGMRDLPFLGNTPQLAWKGPPETVLQHLGIAGEP